jgi:tetratricopeptide (TPR) repeat protein
MTSWDEIKGKIKRAYDEIESAYEKHVVSAVDKVKERPMLNTTVKMSLSAIPIIGPNLRDLYDNIGGVTKSDEDKAKQILEFLGTLEQLNKEQFDRIAKDLKTNRHAIIDAVNENRISLTDLISKSSAEILKEVHSMKEDTSVTRVRVERIETLLEKKRATPADLKRPPKPSTFRGESKIFVGREQDIDTIRNYFEESNLPVSITGEGGIGKSELAYKAMRKCEDMFDLIIPIYLGSNLKFESFLSEMANSLNLPIGEFEKKGLEERRQLITDTLGQGEFKHPLIYADNYETIAGILTIKNSSVLPSEGEEEHNARKINSFLENLPSNTTVLLTSRERHNLDGERPVRLGGLSETEGRNLFLELAKNHFPKGGEPSAEFKKTLKEISRKAGGHPLSIELLARSYRGEGLSKIREMLQHMGVGVVNPKEESERLRSLESCFEYSFNRLPQTSRDLLPKLTLFNSPFPAEAIETIFGFEEFEILLDLYNRSLLRRIEFDEYENDVDTIYHLYYFHLAIRNYLEYKVVGQGNKQDLQERYGEEFSLYYGKLLDETIKAIGTKDHVLALERFNVILLQDKDNDFDKAIRLAKDRSVASFISTTLGLILQLLGMYSKGLEFHEKALAIDEYLQDRGEMAADYANIGVVLYSQGNYDQALDYHKKALAIHEDLQDRVGMAADYTNVAIVLRDQGNYDQALDYHKKALEIDEELKNKVGIARGYTNIGVVLRNQGNYDQALDYHNKALAIHEELNDRVEMGRGYRNIGSVLQDQGTYDQGLQYLKKALAIHEELQDKLGMAADYANIGVVLYSQGNYDQALDYHKKALAIHEDLQDRVGMAMDYKNIGNTLDEMGNHNQALEYHNKALAIHEELNDRVEMAGDYANIGVVLYSQGNYDQAHEYYNKSLEIHEELQDIVGMAMDYGNIGVLLQDQGNYDQSLDYHKKALAIHEELNDRVEMAGDYANIGDVFSCSGDRKRAIESFCKGLEILQEFEENTSYHHPLSDEFQAYISKLKDEKEGAKLES